MSSLDLAAARSRFVALVDALPEDERMSVDGVFWEGASLREVARRCGWQLPGGDYDAKKVERCIVDAIERLRKACVIFDLDFAALFGLDDGVS